MKGFFGIILSIIFVRAVSCTEDEKRDSVVEGATSVEASLKEQIDWLAERYSADLTNKDTSKWNTDEQVKELLNEKAVGIESRLLAIAKEFHKLKSVLCTGVNETPAHVANRVSPGDAISMLYVLSITHRELSSLKNKIDEWKKVKASDNGTNVIQNIKDDRTNTWFVAHGFKVAELNDVTLEKLATVVNELVSHNDMIYINDAMKQNVDKWTKEESERLAMMAEQGISGAKGKKDGFSFAGLSVISLLVAAVAVVL
uniref:Merozoite surface protein Bc28.1 n=1 Tax=Babesia canis TaxID=5867 RepID=A0A0H3ZGY7_BABCA|nr:merozoite surface protein Bc28.1 [Babesia canis]